MTKRYLCSNYGNCAGKCELTTFNPDLSGKHIECPIQWAVTPYWVELTEAMKEAMRD